MEGVDRLEDAEAAEGVWSASVGPTEGVSAVEDQDAEELPEMV